MGMFRKKIREVSIKRSIILPLCMMVLMMLLVACGSEEISKNNQENSNNVQNSLEELTVVPDDISENVVEVSPIIIDHSEEQIIDDKYGTCYQILLYSFSDSDGDGIGDIQGLISRLDYIQDLGANSIWLLPFNPSPSYHKYDVTDYYSIDSQYGTMEDFEELVRECDARNIDLIMDLVINHSSAKHPWFMEATDYIRTLEEGEEPDYLECPYAEYYNFKRSDHAPSGWYKVDGTADWYYECVFWDQMPDLNFDSAAVRTEVEKITSFWIEHGIKGFRLDAALHYYESRTTKNVEVLNWFYNYVESIDPSIYVVAEVWDTYSTLQAYYESDIDSLFNFVLGNRDGLFVSTVNRLGNGKAGASLAANLVTIQNAFTEKNPDYVDGVFLSNHDTGRAAGFLSRKIDKVKLAAGLELLSTGRVFVYYGDELGMSGAGDDVNKRAPMYWTMDATSPEMTDGPPGMVQPEHSFDSLEEQEIDPYSIYNYYREAMHIRNLYPEIGRGVVAEMEEVTSTNGNLMAISKTYDGETIYLVYNVSDEPATITISKETYKYQVLLNSLCVGEDEPILEGEDLYIPAYGCAILK